PNIARQWLGNDYRWLIPISAGLGAAIVLASDLISRAVAFPVETPAGVVIADHAAGTGAVIEPQRGHRVA
ncbi:iron-dicitrate transporter permease subunit, partial [Pseudomonas syringae pv. actinidiae ICMP 18804]